MTPVSNRERGQIEREMEREGEKERGVKRSLFGGGVCVCRSFRIET